MLGYLGLIEKKLGSPNSHCFEYTPRGLLSRGRLYTSAPPQTGFTAKLESTQPEHPSEGYLSQNIITKGDRRSHVEIGQKRLIKGGYPYLDVTVAEKLKGSYGCRTPSL